MLAFVRHIFLQTNPQKQANKLHIKIYEYKFFLSFN